MTSEFLDHARTQYAAVNMVSKMTDGKIAELILTDGVRSRRREIVVYLLTVMCRLAYL